MDDDIAKVQSLAPVLSQLAISIGAKRFADRLARAILSILPRQKMIMNRVMVDGSSPGRPRPWPNMIVRTGIPLALCIHRSVTLVEKCSNHVPLDNIGTISPESETNPFVSTTSANARQCRGARIHHGSDSPSSVPCASAFQSKPPRSDNKSTVPR